MTNTEINAAILEEDFAEIEAKLGRSRDLVDIAQVDICDGKYVPSKTFMYNSNLYEALMLKKAVEGNRSILELDMMVDWSITHVNRNFFTDLFGSYKVDWLALLTVLKPARIVLHHSSITNENLDTVFNTIDPTQTELGLGIHLDDELEEVVIRFDAYPFTYVQIMGIEKVGYGGQGQSGKLIPYIEAFKALRPDTPISIDGGVKLENVKALKDAGATRMTLGSGLFGTDDIGQRMKNLRNEVI